MTLLGIAAAFAGTQQQSPPLATKPEPQQTPEQAKQEEQEPDTQATAGNLVKAPARLAAPMPSGNHTIELQNLLLYPAQLSAKR